MLVPSPQFSHGLGLSLKEKYFSLPDFLFTCPLLNETYNVLRYR